MFCSKGWKWARAWHVFSNLGRCPDLPRYSDYKAASNTPSTTPPLPPPTHTHTNPHTQHAPQHAPNTHPTYKRPTHAHHTPQTALLWNVILKCISSKNRIRMLASLASSFFSLRSISEKSLNLAMLVTTQQWWRHERGRALHHHLT